MDDDREAVDRSVTEMPLSDEYRPWVKADRAHGLEYSGDLTVVPSLEACYTGNAFHYGTDGGQRVQMSSIALKAEARNADSHIVFKLIRTACYGTEGDRWPAVLEALEARPAGAEELIDRERGGIGRTPLHWACAHGAPPHVVAALLALHKDAVLLRDGERKVPLHHALEGGVVRGALGAPCVQLKTIAAMCLALACARR